ncbi:DUF7311 family protein [Halosimplex salinum]|uniref:DUF7311 family protein n=1 Tax=Halosimplex salinum TaxID=1710538 RepID=UPI0013DDF43D|nr:hypothetical protein [Halosimplex salinum]
MVRVAFTVALLVAVAGVAVPATEYVGVQRSDTAVRDAVDRLVGEARALDAGNDPLPSDADPARRSVRVRLPTDGFASAGVRAFAVGPPEVSTSRAADSDPDDPSEGADATRFDWRVAGGTEHTVVADGVRIRPRPGDSLRVSGGRTRLVLELVATDDRTVVRVRDEG